MQNFDAAPPWVKRGTRCFCLGEAQDVFTIVAVQGSTADLTNAQGVYHGRESTTKLRQSFPASTDAYSVEMDTDGFYYLRGPNNFLIYTEPNLDSYFTVVDELNRLYALAVCVS